MHDTSKEIDKINETLIETNAIEIISYLKGAKFYNRSSICNVWTDNEFKRI
jgi:hypothetical protein